MSDKDDQIKKIALVKCNAIMDWAEENDWFDTMFIEKMVKRIEKNDFLTPKMVTAITNIHEKFCDE